MRRLRVLAVIGVVLLLALASAVAYANKPDGEGKHDHPKDSPNDSEGLAIETTNFEFTPKYFVSDGTQTEVEVRLVQGNWHNVTVCHPDAEIVNGVCDLEDLVYPPLLSMDFENKRPIIVDFEALNIGVGETYNYFCRFHISRDMVGTITRALPPS